MTTTTTETLSVDGVVLNTLAKNITSLTGRLRTPDVRGENARVPSRNGAIYTPGKMYDEGQIVLPMWVVGSDDDGAIPYGSDARKMFYKNMDTLTELFRPRRRLLDLRHKLPDGTVRQALCEVQEAIDFTTESYDPIGKFSVVLTVPGSFWQDTVDKVSNQPITSSGQLLTLTEFRTATAPMEDLLYEFVGPWTNPKISATENSVAAVPELSFQYNAAIPVGQSLTVDCANWKLTGSGGLVVDYSKVVHKGSARYMVLTPDDTPRLIAEGSALGTGSALNVTGRRKFLIG